METFRKPFDVEQELTKAVENTGGKRVSDLLGRAPGHESADFLFPADAVIAELKCLDKDLMHDDAFIEKSSNLYVEELKANKAPVVAFGTVSMTTEGFSQEYKDKVENLYRVPIERLLVKADRQIQKTAQALKLAEAKGLFLLANNNHTALDPQHLAYIVEKILSQDLYPSINSAIIFSGNLAASLPGEEQIFDYWIELKRRNRVCVDTALTYRLHTNWYKHLSTVFGAADSPTSMQVGMDILFKLESK